MTQEIENCPFCPFQEYSYNATKELGFGSKYRIMFIGSSPAITSNKSQGNSNFDKFFQGILSKVDIRKSDYYFTNLVKTSIPKGVKPTEEQLKHTLSHVKKEILDVKPQIVVLMGRLVYETFGFKWPGQFIKKTIASKDTKYSTMYYSVEHPGVLHYNAELEQSYLKRLKKIFKYYKPTLI